MPVPVQVGPLGSSASTTLTVPPPPLEEYQPEAGDVWAVAFWLPSGVQVTGPGGWSYGHTVEGVADPETGELGEMTFWWRVLWPGDGVEPVVFVLSGAVRARAVLRAYRPADWGLAVEAESWAPLLVVRWAGELGA